IREWVSSGRMPSTSAGGGDRLAALLAKFAGRDDLPPDTPIESLGLSSLDRVELMVALEDAFQTHIDESAFSNAQDVGQLRSLVERAREEGARPQKAVLFPTWNRSWLARAARRLSLPTWILPVGRLFAWMRVDGRVNLDRIDGPVIFAANHQSH